MYAAPVPDAMADHHLAILPGDGTGPEVVDAGLHVLDAIEATTNLGFERTTIPCGGQHYLTTGEEWAEGSFELCRDDADAILLGAIGWPGASLPNGDLAGGSVILGLRSGLELYANVRPIKLYEGVQHKIHGRFRQVWEPEQVDMVVIRENTEGLYHSLLRRSALRAQGQDYTEPAMEFDGLEGEVAWDPRPISARGSERVIDFAFELAERRHGNPEDGTRKVTCVDKSNVTRGCQLFRRVYEERAKAHPTVATDSAYIDAFTMWLVRNPEWYDVVVTPNMFGDISTDLGSVLQGGMGMAASANLGDGHGMFEPVHGSAPKYTGQNKVNPLATILSVKEMLDWVGRTRGDAEAITAAETVEGAVADVLREGKVRTYDIGGDSSTTDVAEAVAARVRGVLAEM